MEMPRSCVFLPMKQAFVIRLAALLGLLGVTLGAFGAHGLDSLLRENGRVETWETAVLYHLVHSAALLALGAVARPAGLVVWAFTAGIVLFSGPLYVLSLTNAPWLGAIAPLGGTAMLIGWGLLVWRPLLDAD
jgi:uncharacterized membrane protein YgdD (TMEM256/DUF423 family)